MGKLVDESQLAFALMSRSSLLFGRIPMACSWFVFLVVLSVVCKRIQMFCFWKKKLPGRYHRAAGGMHLLLLFCMLLRLSVPLNDDSAFDMFFDVGVGFSGLVLTLTAAQEFGHRSVRNPASGVLETNKLVSHSEMIEHSFYQIVNIVQAVLLHGLGRLGSPGWKAITSEAWGLRLALLALATSPWLLRHRFPVNSFSKNYAKSNSPAVDNVPMLIQVLYRIKKYQYVFYKHALLHGLNICLALEVGGLVPLNQSHRPLVTTFNFKLYWMLLNTSYVFEFFLQTLVKKKKMSQSFLLILQHVLMLAASLAAINILVRRVNAFVALLSLLLNFRRRKRDFENTLVVCLVILIMRIAFD